MVIMDLVEENFVSYKLNFVLLTNIHIIFLNTT